MWADACRDFLPHLQKYLDPLPRVIFVLGKTMWSRMPSTDIYDSEEVQGYRIGDKVVTCIACFHPTARGSRFRWQHVGQVLHNELALSESLRTAA